MTPPDVITLGESMALFVADQPGELAGVERFSRHLVGAESNVAIGLSRLGLRVRWVSRLGADSFGDFVRRSVANENVGAEAVVIKLGADGACYRTASEQGTVPGVPVARVVDTVGAGDGFAAGVISARLEGLDWPCALARGNWVGAQVVQMPGDMEGLPRRTN